MSNLVLFLCLFMACVSLNAQSFQAVYKDKNVAVEKRIDDLLSRMNLSEKLQQMSQGMTGYNSNVNNFESQKSDIKAEIGSLIYGGTNPVFRNLIQKKAVEESRLGIPILFGFDVIHGFKTIYPIPLAQACSWNPELVSKACGVAAKESKQTGIDWTFSPMVDVARDARWGRVAEGYGEDVYANKVFAVAAVNGYQGKKLSDPNSIAACLKHYIGYSLSEGGRDYHYSDVSAQTLWETFMPPFEAGIKAGCATLMSGFNDISGIPASANHYTLTEILKQRWKHDGFVVSDWASIENLIPQGFAKDRKEAGLKSFTAGVEMDMVDNIYTENLPKLLEEKKVSMLAIDNAVRRILRLKFKLGLFENPYVKEIPENERYYQKQDIQIALKLAEESMVLLKNKNNILPISKETKQIALIGPMAKDSVNILGSWDGQSESSAVETIFKALEKEFKGQTNISYAKGCDFEGENTSDLNAALEIAQKADVIVLCLGEKKNWSGENGTRSTIALPIYQENLLTALKRAGKPIVLVLSSGRPIELIRAEPNADAILEMWQPGTAGGTALAGILSGRTNPSGKLAITFPLTSGQIPIYYNMRQPARPWSGGYQDVSSEPLYWFGHGLSYTSFSDGAIKMSSIKIKRNEKLTAEIEISNTGTRLGQETVFWYIADPVASITRPMRELKYFEKKELKAGEKQIYKFEIDPMRDLSFPDSNGIRQLEAGDFYLMVNNQKVKFELTD